MNGIFKVLIAGTFPSSTWHPPNQLGHRVYATWSHSQWWLTAWNCQVKLKRLKLEGPFELIREKTHQTLYSILSYAVYTVFHERQRPYFTCQKLRRLLRLICATGSLGDDETCDSLDWHGDVCGSSFAFLEPDMDSQKFQRSMKTLMVSIVCMVGNFKSSNVIDFYFPKCLRWWFRSVLMICICIYIL